MITEDSKNILVADDSMFFRKRLGDILIEAGHKVEFARDGAHVIELLKAKSRDLDLMTLDLDMPDVTGFGILRWMSEAGITGRPPVIVISSIFQTDEVRGGLLSLGAACFLTKDFSPQELILHVNRILFTEKAMHGVHQRERVPVSIPVDFATKDGAHGGFLLNISKNGAYLKTETQLTKDTIVRMRFSLPDTDKTLTIDGVVRWTTVEKGRMTRFCGGGVMFTAISPNDIARIEIFITNELIRLRITE